MNAKLNHMGGYVQGHSTQKKETKFSLFIMVVIFGYFGLSGYTQSIGDAQTGQGIWGRLIYADFFMLFLCIVSLGYIRRIYFPIEYALFLPFIIYNGMVGLTAYTPRQASIELLVHVWAWGGALVVFNILAKTPERAPAIALKMLLYSTTILSILGLVHLFFLPNLIDVKVQGGVVGTFRNTGQAGSYFGLVLALLIPAMLTGFVKPSRLHIFMMGVIVFALIFTTKRAAIFGLLFGYGGLLLLLIVYGGLKYKKYAFNLMVFSVIVAPLIYYGFEWGKENIDFMRYRLRHKLSEGYVDRFLDNFFEDNIGAGLAAFYDRPVTGVGMGNIAGIYTLKYEVHSTYFKILGTGGILGCGVYLLFLGTWLSSLLKSISTQSREGLYLLYFSPFLAGLIISWGYTYHLRKREFWIAFTISVLVAHVARLKSHQARAAMQF